MCDFCEQSPTKNVCYYCGAKLVPGYSFELDDTTTLVNLPAAVDCSQDTDDDVGACYDSLPDGLSSSAEEIGAWSGLDAWSAPPGAGWFGVNRNPVTRASMLTYDPAALQPSASVITNNLRAYSFEHIWRAMCQVADADQGGK